MFRLKAAVSHSCTTLSNLAGRDCTSLASWQHGHAGTQTSRVCAHGEPIIMLTVYCGILTFRMWSPTIGGKLVGTYVAENTSEVI
jgi:hypothetical protein